MTSYLEKQFSKSIVTIPITTPTPDQTQEDVNVTWDIIDRSSENYAKLQHQQVYPKEQRDSLSTRQISQSCH